MKARSCWVVAATMTSYKNVPPPAGGKAAHYARFIPREELSGFSAWQPGAFESEAADRGVQRPSAEPAKTAQQELAEQLHAARQAGYQDGYRDGLAALENFKRSFAAQTTAQIGALVRSYGDQMDALQQQMATALASAATALARQVVRTELKVQPEQVASVAQEALDTLLLSARHITVRVHPDDHALTAQGAADTLAARGARLVADPEVSRGGCLIESDIGAIDGTIETRWRRAAAALGDETPWQGGAAE
jgi:flagellar assembly protein FliH